MTDDARYAAILARDPRWDGVFFVGVSTTGIYCRPICPARTPGRSRCSFYDTAAQAEAAGFRACFRCRPELAPGNADVDAVDQLVAAAAARIAEGALNDASVDDLATQLGVSARHLRRTMEARLGVSPIDLAQSRRLALAKQLLQDTALSLTEIAFASGFGSIRRFNAVFSSVMGKAPSVLRRAHVDGLASKGLVLRLDYRAPYDFKAILAFLAARAIPGVEHVADATYRRVVHESGHTGIIEVRQSATRNALELVVAPSLVAVLMPLVARVRRMFDLDARPDVIGAVLSRDRVLAPLVRARPGLRVPGAVDGFEAAVRALLGQQVSVAAATTLAGRFAAAFGTPIAPIAPDAAPRNRTQRHRGTEVRKGKRSEIKPGFDLAIAIAPPNDRTQRHKDTKIQNQKRSEIKPGFDLAIASATQNDRTQSHKATKVRTQKRSEIKPGFDLAIAIATPIKRTQSHTATKVRTQTRSEIKPGFDLRSLPDPDLCASVPLCSKTDSAVGCGLESRSATTGALVVRFPTANEVAAKSVDAIAKIGLPGARAAAIHSLACAVANGTVRLDSRDLDSFVANIVELPGIGPWTAHYLAMRALHLPDAFPAADLGIKKALDGAKPREAEARAEAWRPFRSYAVMHLWTGLGGSDAEDDDREVTDRRAAARRQRERAVRVAPSGRRRSGARSREREDTALVARRRAAARILRR